jgi:hypothetical protein
LSLLSCGGFGFNLNFCLSESCQAISLGLLNIVQIGALTNVSFKSLVLRGAKGDKYGVPKDLKEAIWINIAKSPIAIPYPPITAARMRSIKRIIAPESVCAGTTKLDTAVRATTMTIGAPMRPADTADSPITSAPTILTA